MTYFKAFNENNLDLYYRTIHHVRDLALGPESIPSPIQSKIILYFDRKRVPDSPYHGGRRVAKNEQEFLDKLGLHEKVYLDDMTIPECARALSNRHIIITAAGSNMQNFELARNVHTLVIIKHPLSFFKVGRAPFKRVLDWTKTKIVEPLESGICDNANQPYWIEDVDEFVAAIHALHDSE